MTFNTPGLQRLDEKLFYFPNFLDQEEVTFINSKIIEAGTQTHPFQDFGSTGVVPDLFPIWKKISEVLAPDYVIHPLLNLLHYKAGSSMLPHCDSPGEGNHEDLTMPDVWSTCCLLEFGVCLYFGEFTGGEVYYPNQNIQIAVQPGDLVIHGALSDYSHGVKEVLSGSRFVYSNFCLRADKNPGTFHNYGTDEFNELTSDIHYVQTKWQTPLVKNKDIIVLDHEPTKYHDEYLENKK